MAPGKLFHQLEKLLTEQRNPASETIDLASTHEILSIINREDRKVAEAVTKVLPRIAAAVDLIERAFRHGGRLIYVGAGTSGRLGVMDAAECPPTFGTPARMVQAVMAGGRNAVFRSREGAEDRKEEGARAMKRLRISNRDVVCGVAASMRTPYVVGAIEQARKMGAHTLLITTNPRRGLTGDSSRLQKSVDVAISPVVGPEVVMGSTRMKSGTAQKLVLNMLSTAAMIRIGKVYGNMMVDLKMNSRKLEERARRVVMASTGADYRTAGRVLREADHRVKTAIVMIKANVSLAEARRRLNRASGFVRKALGK